MECELGCNYSRFLQHFRIRFEFEIKLDEYKNVIYNIDCIKSLKDAKSLVNKKNVLIGRKKNCIRVTWPLVRKLC